MKWRIGVTTRLWSQMFYLGSIYPAIFNYTEKVRMPHTPWEKWEEIEVSWQTALKAVFSVTKSGTVRCTNLSTHSKYFITGNSLKHYTLLNWSDTVMKYFTVCNDNSHTCVHIYLPLRSCALAVCPLQKHCALNTIKPTQGLLSPSCGILK
jgi:hypothetical protein